MNAASLDRIPVIVGAAQVVQRPGEQPLDRSNGPIELMVAAARDAAADAGAPGLLARLGWVGVAPGWYRHRDPGALVAAHLGCTNASTALAAISGTAAQDLTGLACARIATGSLDAALVVGGEARWSSLRLKRDGVAPPWQQDATTSDPEHVSGFPDEMLAELSVLGSAAGAYALFEDRLRAAAGETPAAHAARIAGLWAGFSAVAAANPYAWDRTTHTAAEIATPSPSNRLIAFPYTKAMVANNTVDMGSALLVCSLATARAAGVADDRMVFPQVVTHSHETWQVVARRELHRSPALETAGRAAFARAGVGPAEIDHIDLYACFPSIVQMSSAALGLPTGRPLTLTGGLGFAGAPVANAVGQSLAATVGAVRTGGWGLVHGNGGWATKQSFGIYRAEPPAAGFADIDVQEEVDLAPREVLPAEWAGACTIEAATVLYDRDGPAKLIAAVLDDTGARGWATSTAPDLFAEVERTGIAGLPAKRGAGAELLL